MTRLKTYSKASTWRDHLLSSHQSTVKVPCRFCKKELKPGKEQSHLCNVLQESVSEINDPPKYRLLTSESALYKSMIDQDALTQFSVGQEEKVILPGLSMPLFVPSKWRKHTIFLSQYGNCR